MNGSVQIKKGMWYTVICFRDDDGKNKHKWENTGLKERGNKKEANRIPEERLAAWEEADKVKEEKLKRRLQPKKEDLDKANWQFTKYIKEYVEGIKDTLSPNVYKTYSSSFINVFAEYFDKNKLRLIDVTTEEIKGFYEYAKKERGVKDITLKHYANVLRPALKEAFKAGIIPDNPYDFMPTISKGKSKVGFYDKTELELFLEKLKGHRLELAYKMLAYYGFRRSELLGLRWQSIDFDHNTITVNHKVLRIDKKFYLEDKLKTQSSNRTLPLIPTIRQGLLEQKKIIEENKQFFGDAYNQEFLDYIFVNDEGRLLYPDHVSDAFDKFLKDNDLKRIRLHDLRHSCASLLVANGVPMKQIQDRLGHANFSTTADVYSHLDFSTKVQSANVIQNALGFEGDTQQVAPKQPIIIQEALAAAYQEMRKFGFRSLDEYFEYLQNPNSDIGLLFERDEMNSNSRKAKDIEM